MSEGKIEKLRNELELKMRPTEEIIAHHLGSISGFLAAISTDIRFIRKKIEDEFDDS